MNAQTRAVPPSVNAWNIDYLDEQYRQFKADPNSVTADVRAFFQGFELAREGATLASTEGPTDAVGSGASILQQRVDALVDTYRNLGHLASKLDPFGRESEPPAALDLAYHGISPGELNANVRSGTLNLPETATLQSIVDKLERTYCGTIGAEFGHVQDVEVRSWLIERFERLDGRIELDRAERLHILRQLLQAEVFEMFLGRRYPGEKRFTLEGSESLIPLLDRVASACADSGVEELVLGMAHRGRLNVLNNIVGKTYEQIFTEFEDNWEEDFADGGGDVKYHRGYSGERHLLSGKVIRIALSSNPSHLEAVDAVVQGRCRAKQRLIGDKDRRRVVPVLVHGDAAIAGQGMVAEVLNLAHLDGFATGGTIHIVVNNLIGFTTSPEDARSTRYCTDVAKMVDAPIFHVNGEDPEAVVAVAQFAAEFRQQFKRDVFIDMYCFRKYGHNEQDEASFTQPLLYKLIKNKASVLKVYAERLLAGGHIDESDMRVIRDRLDEALEHAQDAARQSPYDPTIDPGGAKWKGFQRHYTHDPVDTTVSKERLAEVCAALGRTPEGFNLNRKLKSLLKSRAGLLDTKEISYADAEALAYGTLLLEGVAVRLTGQDVCRGTFSHRHAVLRDSETGEPYTSLNHIREVGEPGTEVPPGSNGPEGQSRQAKLCIHDSPLSEQSVLGFEYGYSLADPDMLVLWEAQFGDFCNGAQVIIDQFLASAEMKWDRWSGLTLLLPHGYEGAGPEHSSARMERFLQLCAGDNMQVVYPSTAAQVFHLFRRQVKRPFRKPLIVMTPKSMLRTPTSSIDELITGSGGGFRELLDDPAMIQRGDTARKGVKRVILCSGKIYHELAERRDEINRGDVAIVRFEQLYPFHEKLAREILTAYPESAEWVWVQEEPRNVAAYMHMSETFQRRFKRHLRYIGREASPTPAVGSKRKHKAEQEAILEAAVGPKPAAETDDTTKAPHPEPARA